MIPPVPTQVGDGPPLVRDPAARRRRTPNIRAATIPLPGGSRENCGDFDARRENGLRATRPVRRRSCHDLVAHVMPYSSRRAIKRVCGNPVRGSALCACSTRPFGAQPFRDGS